MPRTSSAKVLVPRLPSSFVERTRLDRFARDAREARLTLVIAGAGFGKSALLAGWAREAQTAWYAVDAGDDSLRPFASGLVDSVRVRVPRVANDLAAAVDSGLGPQPDDSNRAEAFAASLCQQLEEELHEGLLLVLDDVHLMDPASPSVAAIEALCRHAPRLLHIVVSSRRELPFPIERLRARGEVVDVPARELAFTADECADFIDAALGADATPEVGRLFALTQGWPAAVRLAVEAMRSQSRDADSVSVDGLRQPDGLLFGYLAEEVFAAEKPEVQDLLQVAARLGPFTAELCEELGVVDADRILAQLQHRGLYIEPHAVADGWFTVSALVRDFVLLRVPLDDARAHSVARQAAKWYAANGQVDEGLRLLRQMGEVTELAHLLAAHGAALLASGEVAQVIIAAESIPADQLTPEILAMLGEAHQVRGEWEPALKAFGAAFGEEGPLPAALAWRMGLINYHRGLLDEAVRVFGRGVPEGAEDRDLALLNAWTATAHWLRGNVDACRTHAQAALTFAQSSGDDGALAAAHTSLAMLAASDGDRQANDAHYLRALEAAERGHDVLQVCRIRCNRSSRFLEEGYYNSALAELAIAIPLAEITGFTTFLALGLNNRGSAYLRMGKLEQAMTDFEASRVVYADLDSASAAYGLCGVADVYRMRGDLALARATFEQTLALAEPEGDIQALVPAYAGLARTIGREEPAAALALVDRALSYGTGIDHIHAVIAGGWVSIVDGDRQAAEARADEAAAVARSRRDRAGLAESLELRAACATSTTTSVDLLDEAAGIWREVHNELGVAMNEVARARLVGSSAEIAAAERRLAELGVRPHAAGAAGLLAAIRGPMPAPIVIHTLGGFRLLRMGYVVEAAQWPSREARTVLKRLVARRGRPLPMDGADEAVLSELRGVLDPDGEFAPNQFVADDGESVWLHADRIEVDVDRLLADAARGSELHGAGRVEEARAVWESAERTYSGDFLEEHAGDTWAVPVREEARATYVGVARRLAKLAADRGDVDAAVRYWLRILERDEYDEAAHLGLVDTLVSAGRHGEARRTYRRYATAMRELGLESVPFPVAGMTLDAERSLASVLFTDLVDSTAHAAAAGDRAWREVINRHEAVVREAASTHRGRLVRTIGDGALFVFDSPARAIAAANEVCARMGEAGLAVRAGVHAGEVEVMTDDVGGIAVHIAARICALSGPGEVLVSRTVRDLLSGSEFRFADHGEHQLKGVPDSWQIFRVI